MKLQAQKLSIIEEIDIDSSSGYWIKEQIIKINLQAIMIFFPFHLFGKCTSRINHHGLTLKKLYDDFSHY